MIKISDIVGKLAQYQAAQGALAECRQRSTGDVEYFSHSYVQDLKQAEDSLEQTLNAYIDQRIAQRQPAARFEPLTPVATLAA